MKKISFFLSVLVLTISMSGCLSGVNKKLEPYGINDSNKQEWEQVGVQFGKKAKINIPYYGELLWLLEYGVKTPDDIKFLVQNKVNIFMMQQSGSCKTFKELRGWYELGFRDGRDISKWNRLGVKPEGYKKLKELNFTYEEAKKYAYGFVEPGADVIIHNKKDKISSAKNKLAMDAKYKQDRKLKEQQQETAKKLKLAQNTSLFTESCRFIGTEVESGRCKIEGREHYITQLDRIQKYVEAKKIYNKNKKEGRIYAGVVIGAGEIFTGTNLEFGMFGLATDSKGYNNPLTPIYKIRLFKYDATAAETQSTIKSLSSKYKIYPASKVLNKFLDKVTHRSSTLCFEHKGDLILLTKPYGTRKELRVSFYEREYLSTQLKNIQKELREQDEYKSKRNNEHL